MALVGRVAVRRVGMGGRKEQRWKDTGFCKLENLSISNKFGDSKKDVVISSFSSFSSFSSSGSSASLLALSTIQAAGYIATINDDKVEGT